MRKWKSPAPSVQGFHFFPWRLCCQRSNRITVLKLNRKSVESVNARSKSDKVFLPRLLNRLFDHDQPCRIQSKCIVRTINALYTIEIRDPLQRVYEILRTCRRIKAYTGVSSYNKSCEQVPPVYIKYRDMSRRMARRVVNNQTPLAKLDDISIP